MRELTAHKSNKANNDIEVVAMDGPGPGGASHRYRLSYPNGTDLCVLLLEFQNGPIKEVGVNGITHEALLAVLIDRMKGFQEGEFACHENAIALSNLKGALRCLLVRTAEREARGVEGTHEK